MKPNTRKKLIVIVLVAVVAYLLIRKRKVVSPNTSTNAITGNNVPVGTSIPPVTIPTPTEPPPGLIAPNWNIGLSNMFGYGSSWQNEFNKMPNGTSLFWFYGKSNGNNYPSGKNGNGYETVHFSSHSVTSAQGYAGVISKCRYTLRDAANNVVLYVDDTKGGFHAFYGNDLRANNHPDDVLRYLPTGTYSLEYANTSDSPAPQSVEFYQQHENNTFDYQINEVVQSGQSITRSIVIADTGSEQNTFYKLNNNLR